MLLTRILILIKTGLLIATTTFSGCTWGSGSSNVAAVETISPKRFYDDATQQNLALAVDRNDTAGVAAAIEKGADVNARGAFGYSLLYWAMRRGRLRGFEELVKHGADVKALCRDRQSHSSSREGDYLIRVLLADSESDFLAAALRQGVDPDYVVDEPTNESLVVLACRRHAEKSIGVLLEGGANVEHKDASGYTALGCTILRRDYKTASFLLSRGASPTTGADCKCDAVSILREYGSRGVRPDQEEYFEKVVADLIDRGLITRQDIVEADKPKPSVLGGPPGVTVIEHPADSEAGRAIRQLDERERAATGRERK